MPEKSLILLHLHAFKVFRYTCEKNDLDLIDKTFIELTRLELQPCGPKKELDVSLKVEN